MASFRAVQWVLLVLLGCGPQRTVQPGTNTPTLIAVARSGELSVELLSVGPLVVGQNRVFYRVTVDGAAVPHADFVQKPLLKEPMGEQSCPVVNPDHAPNAEGMFEGLLIFTRPSSALEEWSLQLNVKLVREEGGVWVDFGTLRVADSAGKNVVTRDGKEIVLSLGYSQAPHVGSNEVVITAHQATDGSMKEFVTVDDLVFTLTPEMESMGHGATGSVNPARVEPGLYRGTVVFSMSGDWVLHLKVTANDAQLGAFDFPVGL